MEIVFNEKYWGLIIVISLFVAAGLTWLVYYKSPNYRELKRWQLYSLMTLRFMSVFIVAFILTGPLLKTLRRMIQNPLVIVAVDNSVSMIAFEDKETIVPQKINWIRQIQNILGDKFELATYTFGEKVERSEQIDFAEKGSAYGDMLQAIYNNHFNDNIGALVVIGDGIYNLGENPLNFSMQLGYPVYALALGDTTIYRDASILGVSTNKNAFLGNKFPVEVDIRYQGMPGQTLKFSIQHRGSTVYSEQIFTYGGDGFRTITTNLDAENAGLQYYVASVEANVEEKNHLNNEQRFVINVLENKQKILMLSSGSHPDAGAIRSALENQVNYDVSLYTQEPFPADLREYNLLILNQVPSAALSGRNMVEEATRLKLPVLFILGSQSHIQQFNLLGTGVEIVLQAGNMEDAQSIINKDFAAFTISDILQESLEKYPPLKVPFGRYQLNGSWNTVLYQRLRNIQTDRPILSVANRNGVKSGVIFGEGIWRWRMYDYLMHDTHTAFNELIDKVVQYLALRDNEDNFIVHFRPVYQETESVIMTAEVYNDSYEPVTTPEVSIVLRDSTNQEFVLLFDRGSQFYRMDAGVFPPGDYKFEAKVELGDIMYTETGNFAVMPVNIELMETQANHRLLYQLAQQTGGGLYYPDEIDRLIASIEADSRIKPFSYFQTLLTEILNLKWIFFITLLVLSLEWFLRKYWGIY